MKENTMSNLFFLLLGSFLHAAISQLNGKSISEFSNNTSRLVINNLYYKVWN